MQYNEDIKKIVNRRKNKTPAVQEEKKQEIAQKPADT